jgi:hypothetical protein
MLIERLHNSKYAEENGLGNVKVTIVAQGALEICDAAHCLEVMKKK